MIILQIGIDKIYDIFKPYNHYKQPSYYLDGLINKIALIVGLFSATFEL